MCASITQLRQRTVFEKTAGVVNCFSHYNLALLVTNVGSEGIDELMHQKLKGAQMPRHLDRNVRWMDALDVLGVRGVRCADHLRSVITRPSLPLDCSLLSLQLSPLFHFLPYPRLSSCAMLRTGCCCLLPCLCLRGNFDFIPFDV